MAKTLIRCPPCGARGTLAGDEDAGSANDNEDAVALEALPAFARCRPVGTPTG